MKKQQHNKCCLLNSLTTKKEVWEKNDKKMIKKVNAE